VGELSGTNGSTAGLVGDHTVDGTGSNKSSENLSDNHADGLYKVLSNGVGRVAGGQAESSVDEDSNCDSGVVMSSGNLGSDSQKVEETEANGGGVTSGSVDNSDEHGGTDQFVECDDSGVSEPLATPSIRLLSFHL